jgi:predicted homoserine dehydrogenase-like protein
MSIVQDGSLVYYRPYHLCGVETPMTILCAGLLGIGTGALDYRPLVDLHMRAMRDLHAGEILGNDHSPDLQALIRPARAARGSAPLPFHMGNGNRLRVDVPAGTLISVEMIDRPEGSDLWALRGEQDEIMGLS